MKIFGVLFLLFLVTVSSAQIPTDSLIAYYPFNGNANDSSGNGRHFTVHGPILSSDRFGRPNGAYEFNGTSDWLGATATGLPTSDRTVSVWFYSDSLDPGRMLLAYGGGGAGQSFDMLLNNQETVPNSYWVEAGWQVNSVWWTYPTPPVGSWFHWVVTTNSVVTNFYVNGVLVKSSPTVFTGTLVTNKPWVLGSAIGPGDIVPYIEGGAAQYWRGKMDDICIYNRALSESEIDSLYHEGGWDMPSIISVVVGNIDVTVNDTVDIPVTAKFPIGKTYSSIELSFVGFQNSGVTFLNVDTTDCLIGERGWQLLFNNTDSMLIIASAGSQDISDSLLLFRLKFLVSGYPCSSVPIEIKDAVFNTGLDSVIKINGGININPIAEYGDVDSNGHVQAFDASLILKHLVGLDTLNCQSMWNAMVHCDTTLTAFDATIILQRVAKLIDTLPFCLQQQASGVITMSGGTRRIGDIIEIPLNLSNANNIYSYEGTITYDPSKLEYDGIIADGVFSNDSFIARDRNGFVRFAGARIVPNDSTNFFATIRFRVKNDGVSSVTLSELRWNTQPIQKNVASTTIVTDVGDLKEEIPQYFSLYQNQPNPFNPTTTFKYDLPTESKVKLSIYNVLGQIAEILIDEVESPGYRSVDWNARGMVSGVYFYRIEATSISDPSKSFMQVKKMLLLK